MPHSSPSWRERILRAVLLALPLSLIAGAPAWAEPPGNDARTAPQALGTLPALVRGTTAEATLEPDEPVSGCDEIKGSVWYAFRADASRDLLVALDAAGDMDAVVELFVRERSQLTPVSCERTNRRGLATIDADATAGTDYLVRVAPLANSVEDRFTLRVVQPDPPARPPGRPLPSGGATGQVDRFAHPDDAWAVRLREGRTYRINLVTTGRGCALATLYAPGRFGSRAEDSLSCDGFTVFTPPASGLYTIRVRAPRASRAQLPYRLRVGPARADDSAPGILLRDDRRVRGTLAGDELDALDLYRFTLARRSDLQLRLRSTHAFQMRLLTDGGRRIATGSQELTRRLRPGRYFVAVRALDGARGTYVVSRLARTITHSTMLADGRRATTAAPGATVALALRVRPDVGGAATLLVERYDPLAGWLFFERRRVPVRAGAATLAFRPPSVGRWRVSGQYEGTRTASPSSGGTARFTILEPLSG